MSEIVKSSGVTGAMQIRSVADMQNVAGMLAKSGYFSDARDMAQCFVKVLAGSELGVGAFASMTGIHVIKGKPTLGAGLMASKVKSHPDYNYRVIEHTAQVCKIEFFERWDGRLQSVGISEFTADDAKRVGTQNMNKFPKNMLFARAMSNGVKWYCPGVFSTPVYTPEELGAQTDGEGNVIDVTPEPPTDINPIAKRFNFIASKTGHNKQDAISFANALNIPPSTQQMTEEEFVQLRNHMLADWGLAQGCFNHINHAKASLGHLPNYDTRHDQELWGEWQEKVGMKLAEMDAVRQETVEAQAEVA